MLSRLAVQRLSQTVFDETPAEFFNVVVKDGPVVSTWPAAPRSGQIICREFSVQKVRQTMQNFNADTYILKKRLFSPRGHSCLWFARP